MRERQSSRKLHLKNKSISVLDELITESDIKSICKKKKWNKKDLEFIETNFNRILNKYYGKT